MKFELLWFFFSIFKMSKAYLSLSIDSHWLHFLVFNPRYIYELNRSIICHLCLQNNYMHCILSIIIYPCIMIMSINLFNLTLIQFLPKCKIVIKKGSTAQIMHIIMWNILVLLNISFHTTWFLSKNNALK